MRHGRGSLPEVLGFLGEAHRQFRFDLRFRALTGMNRAGLRLALEEGFVLCQRAARLQLDRVARETVLGNVGNRGRLDEGEPREELRPLGRSLRLKDSLARADLDLDDVYRLPTAHGRGSAERQGFLPRSRRKQGTDPVESAAILHRDDRERLSIYRGHPAALAAACRLHAGTGATHGGVPRLLSARPDAEVGRICRSRWTSVGAIACLE